MQFAEPPRGRAPSRSHRHRHQPYQQHRRPADPWQSPVVVPFRAFAAWTRSQDNEVTEDAISEKYQSYRREMQGKVVSAAFKAYKDEEWFKERYHPETSKAIRSVANERKRGFLKEFAKELVSGMYDKVSFDALADAQFEINKKPEETMVDLTEEDVVEVEEQEETTSPVDNKPASNTEAYKIFHDHRSFPTVIIKILPLAIKREVLMQHVSVLAGFKCLQMGVPLSQRRQYRSAWVVFDSMEHAQEAHAKLNEAKIGEFTLHCGMQTNLPAVIKTVPFAAHDRDRLCKDLEQAKSLVDVLQEEAEMKSMPEAAIIRNYINNLVEQLADKSEQKEEGEEHGVTMVQLKKELDLWLFYLARLHQLDYYSMTECECPEDFTRKSITLRSASPSPPGKDINHVFARLDERVRFRVFKLDSGDEIISNGGVDVNVHQEISLKNKVKQEGEGKFRCVECSKLFKDEPFVMKHLHTKHPEMVAQINEDILYLNAYARDCNKLLLPVPSRDDRQDRYDRHDRHDRGDRRERHDRGDRSSRGGYRSSYGQPQFYPQPPPMMMPGGYGQPVPYGYGQPMAPMPPMMVPGGYGMPMPYPSTPADDRRRSHPRERSSGRRDYRDLDSPRGPQDPRQLKSYGDLDTPSFSYD